MCTINAIEIEKQPRNLANEGKWGRFIWVMVCGSTSLSLLSLFFDWFLFANINEGGVDDEDEDDDDDDDDDVNFLRYFECRWGTCCWNIGNERIALQNIDTAKAHTTTRNTFFFNK